MREDSWEGKNFKDRDKRRLLPVKKEIRREREVLRGEKKEEQKTFVAHLMSSRGLIFNEKKLWVRGCEWMSLSSPPLSLFFKCKSEGGRRKKNRREGNENERERKWRKKCETRGHQMKRREEEIWSHFFCPRRKVLFSSFFSLFLLSTNAERKKKMLKVGERSVINFFPETPTVVKLHYFFLFILLTKFPLLSFSLFSSLSLSLSVSLAFFGRNSSCFYPKFHQNQKNQELKVTGNSTGNECSFNPLHFSPDWKRGWKGIKSTDLELKEENWKKEREVGLNVFSIQFGSFCTPSFYTRWLMFLPFLLFSPPSFFLFSPPSVCCFHPQKKEVKMEEKKEKERGKKEGWNG